MRFDSEEFSTTYAKLTQEELLELARAYGSLTEPAQAALRAEFARRQLEPPFIEEISEDQRSHTLVTIRRYRDLSEALVARSLLESAGIYTFLRDENLVRLDWQVSNFIGGIRLQVEDAEAAAAVELLEQSAPTSIPYGEETEFTQPQCPMCGSIDLTFEGRARGAALASLYMLSLPLPLGRETWVCNSCNARWEENSKT
jgi:hypothetical protein